MATTRTGPPPRNISERFYVEVAPGYVRLQHQLGVRTFFGRGRLTAIEQQIVRSLTAIDRAGQPIEWSTPDPDEYAELLASEDRARQEAEEAVLDDLGPAAAEYLEAEALARAQQAAMLRLGRGAKGMSERSRREMWRWVLSLPFEMLGDRPLWITLTYPGGWERWVPDGPTLERHRRAFGEAWYRNFGERPVGFWAKEFQLEVGRPHLHLLMKGPAAMVEWDYWGFQVLTRLGNANVKKFGKRKGRWWTPPIGGHYGGRTAEVLLRSWSQIATGGTVENHARRGVNVRTVFFAHDDTVAASKRRSAIAAYMAGEAAKAGQKVPPVGFGTVGRYFGTFGYRSGFRPTVERLEVDEAVWGELNRRLTLLDSIRRRAKGRPLSDEAKRRRPWQGLTVAGVGAEEFARLFERSHAAALRRRPPSPTEVSEPPGSRWDGRPGRRPGKAVPQSSTRAARASTPFSTGSM